MTKAICVWYWFIFLPYVCPFLKFLCRTINWWLCKQNITWLRRSVHKRKAETVQSDTVGYYHRSKLCCLGILKLWILTLLIFCNYFWSFKQKLNDNSLRLILYLELKMNWFFNLNLEVDLYRSIGVIYLNLTASMRLFTFDTNGGYLLSMRLAVMWHFFERQRSTAIKLHYITCNYDGRKITMWLPDACSVGTSHFVND